MATAAEIVRFIELVQTPDGWHHDEEDHESGTSCTMRPVIRDLDMHRGRDRGTILKDDAGN